MAQPTGERVPLYEVRWNGQDDYLPDAALTRIEEVVLSRLPTGFDVGHQQNTAKGVTATLHLDGPADPFGQAEAFEAMLQAVTVVRTLHANLTAARAALSGSSTQGAGT